MSKCKRFYLMVAIALVIIVNVVSTRGVASKNLKAVDSLGSITTNRLRKQQPNGESVVVSTQDIVYSEGFDAGAPGWTFRDLWSEAFWHVSTTGAYSGKSYWCGIEERGGYDDSWQQTLTSPSISLSGATAPVLTFMHHYRAEPLSGGYPSGFNAWDAQTVRLSTDGQNFVVIKPTAGAGYQATSAYGFNQRFGTGMAGWAGNSGGWVAASFNLAAYVGQTVQIQFLFGSDQGYSHQNDATLFGWRVDDIKIIDGSTTIFDDDAGDTGTAQFVAGGPGGPNPWHLTATAAASTPNSAGCFDTATGNYLSGMKAGLVSPTIAISTLPTDTQVLIANFQYQGAFDPTGYAGGSDLARVEVRAHRAGAWSYWFTISGTTFIPASFSGYSEVNNVLDISALIGADSIQFRVFVLTRPDGNVVPPARVFIDDFTLAATGIIGPQFGTFLARITAAANPLRPAIVDSFMATISSFPFIEEKTIVYFLYRGTAGDIFVPGEANGWNNTGSPMTAIAGTNLWYRQEVFESDARLNYQFNRNGNLIADPLNPNQSENVSVLAMPDYTPPPEIDFFPNIPHGALRDTTISSRRLGYARGIKVYAPPSYETALNTSFPLVFFYPGSGETEANVLDYLISEGRIQPVIAVFLPFRGDESGLRSQYQAFIVKELLPLMDARYRTRRDPASRVIFGFSAFGFDAAQISFDSPESFGLCGAYSAPFEGTGGAEIFRHVVNGPKKSIKFYLDWGKYDYVSIRANSRALRDSLLEYGYEVNWNEWHEGHNIYSWGSHLDNALEYFYPANVVTVKDNETVPSQFSLYQNYPNPFNPSTTIRYALPHAGVVTLKIFNVQGQELAILVHAKQAAGEHAVSWRAEGLSSGLYLYRLQAGDWMETKKMILAK